MDPGGVWARLEGGGREYSSREYDGQQVYHGYPPQQGYQQQQQQPGAHNSAYQQPAKRQRLAPYAEPQLHQRQPPRPQQQQQPQQPHSQQQAAQAGPEPAASRQLGQQRQEPQQQEQQQQDKQGASAAWLDQLQSEIQAFTAAVVPNNQEQQDRDGVLRDFTAAAKLALPEYQRSMGVTLFGSGAAGLALHSSDIDVAITSIVSPNPSGSFDEPAKSLAVSCLRRIERALRWGASRDLLGLTDSRLVARARVPVLKLQLGSGLELDVSLNDDGGLKAARFVQSFQSDYPAIKPLTLLLKCILKQRSLSEVYHGGLGSWSLVNMVIAHIMDEDHRGANVDHLGAMLLSFLRRYGFDFNVMTDAVAVQRGGFVKKAALGMEFNRNSILALHDPLTGREVAGGSHRYQEVIGLFQRLFRRLEAAQEAAQQPGSAGNGSGRSQRRNSRHGTEYEDEDGSDGGYDAANRSPTYKARVVHRGQQQQQPEQRYVILKQLLDCQELLQRSDCNSSQPDSNRASNRDPPAGHQWQWGNGIRGGAGGGGASYGMAGQHSQQQSQYDSRKRDRWHI